MDDAILKMYVNYFKMLEVKGISSKSMFRQLVLLDFLNEVSKDEEIYPYLEDEDILYINSYTKCLLNNCLNH